ncbi:hypothetical protein [Halobacillus litoralis]|uniref:Uncharacterized protein n=1 Tax=Halobacillus litoralis TaxID=45668 RepID=A0A410MIM7_9BACI|nr:hypothetical protein [Halobacillus litoralis]QAS54538.1 hypothetical protein HLI_02325 [Halobacillus litoralis]
MKTDHEQAFEIFDETLSNSELFDHVEFKKVAGLPFVYLTVKDRVERNEIEAALKQCAAKAMRGKRLTLAMSYVRKNQALQVYRVRFLVPQRKMFCCGNLCDDCIRFTDP